MGDGIKHDKGKLRWSLLPWNALREVVEVMEFGAREYGVENWQRLAEPERRYLDALIRHVVAHASGEERDPKTGMRHLAHAATNALFLIWFARKADAARIEEIMSDDPAEEPPPRWRPREVPHKEASGRAIAKISKMTPEEARKSFQDAGIIDADGKLTGPYATPSEPSQSRDAERPLDAFLDELGEKLRAAEDEGKVLREALRRAAKVADRGMRFDALALGDEYLMRAVCCLSGWWSLEDEPDRERIEEAIASIRAAALGDES